MTRALLSALLLLLVLASPARAGWSAPGPLAPANAAGHDPGTPSVAVAPDGTAFVAFSHWDGQHLRAAVAMRSPGGGFGPVRDLSGGAGDAFSVTVAVDRQGNATLAWDDGAIEARFRPAGGDWGPLQTLATGSVFDPSLAVSDNGSAIVGWWRSGATWDVEAATRSPGSSAFAAGLTVSAPAAGSQGCEAPQVATDAAGDAVALWTRRTPDPNAQYHVESAVKPAGQAAWSAPEPRSSTSGSTPCNLDLHMTPDGRATAMWDFQEIVGGVAQTDYVASADRSAPFAGGTWGQQVKLSNTAVPSVQGVFALDAAGNAAATWVTNPFQAGAQMLSSVRSAGGPFTAPQTLSNATTPAHRGQAVAASDNGDAITLFMSTVNGDPAVFAARRTGGGAFAPAAAIAADVDSPGVALDDQGNAFAAFVAGGTTVQVAAFDPVPPVITAASVPAAATTGAAVGMTAAATDRMSVPALHFDFGDGSSADGGSVSHIYAAPGTYTVTVSATDAAGNRSATTGAIQVSNPPPPPPGPIIIATTLSWDRLPNGNTRLRKLVVEGLRGPETVRLSCAGKGCRKPRTRTFRKHGKKLVLTKYVHKLTLHPKAKLTISATRPGFIARTITYTMVKHRDPKKATVCRPPGAKRARAC